MLKKIILMVLFLVGFSLSSWAEECPADQPLILAEGRSCVDGWDKNGNLKGECGYHKLCVDCNYTEEVYTTKINCTLCPNREYRDGKCVLKKENK